MALIMNRKVGRKQERKRAAENILRIPEIIQKRNGVEALREIRLENRRFLKNAQRMKVRRFTKKTTQTMKIQRLIKTQAINRSSARRVMG